MHLEPKTEQRIATLLKGSRLPTEDELVNKALDVLEDLRQAERDMLMAVDVGIADSKAGNTIPAAEVFAELRARRSNHSRPQ